MFLLSEIPTHEVAPEAGALESMSASINEALDLNNLAKATRLLASKTTLRALIMDKCRCKRKKICLKCDLFIDQNDLVGLLNFFAKKLIAFRLEMHKRATISLTVDTISERESLTRMYRRIMIVVFPGIRTHADLREFREDVIMSCIDHAAQKTCWLTELLLSDRDFAGCIYQLRSVAGLPLHSSTRRVVAGILQTGAQIAKITETTLDETGDCFIEPQYFLYQLLVAHDRQRSDLFAAPNSGLRLQH